MTAAGSSNDVSMPTVGVSVCPGPAELASACGPLLAGRIADGDRPGLFLSVRFVGMSATAVAGLRGPVSLLLEAPLCLWAYFIGGTAAICDVAGFAGWTVPLTALLGVLVLAACV